MPWTIEAVYEDGVLKPLQEVELEEHQQVSLTIDAPRSARLHPQRRLEAAQRLSGRLAPALTDPEQSRLEYLESLNQGPGRG